MKSSIDNSDKDKNSFRSSLSNRENETASLTPTLSFLSERLNDYLLDLIEIKSELLREQKQKEQLLSEIRSLHEEKGKVEQQKNLLQEEIEQIKKQLQETELLLKKVEERFNLEQIEHQIDKTQLRDLQEKLHQKEQESIEIRNQKAEAEKTISNLTQKLQTTTKELSNASIRIAELENTNHQLAEVISEQKEQLHQKEKEIEQSQKSHEQLRKQIEELQGTISALKNYVKTQQQIIDKLVHDKEGLIQEKRQLELERKKLLTERQNQEEQQKRIEQKHGEILEQCQRLLQTIEGLKQEKQRYLQEYHLALRRNEELLEALKYWQNQVTSLQEQIALIGNVEEIVERENAFADYTRLVLAYQRIEKESILLGELLVEAQFISRSQLDEIVSIQKEKPHCKLGTLLLERGWIKEIPLFQALSLQKNIPLVFLDESHVNIEQAYLLGYSFCLEYLFIPLRAHSQDRIVIASAEPDNQNLIDELEKIFSLPVRGFYACSTHIITMLEKIFERE